MTERQKPRKLRRFFTAQTLRLEPHDLWLEPAEAHHLRDSIRLRLGDACLVTDGQGGEAEAVGAVQHVTRSLAQCCARWEVTILGPGFRLLPE